MSKNIKKQSNNKHAAKKAMILDSNKKNRTPLRLIIAALVVVGGAIAVYSTLAPTSASVETQTVQTTTATPSNVVVSFTVSEFDDGKARHFQHSYGDITIKYFVLKSADGVIRAAFDACDVCWPAGKGYFQDGDVMVCRNCGRRFASVQVNEVSGGCNPAPLTRQIQGDKVMIQVKDIIAGKNYFDYT
jgi:uncharacterized membrane protein